MTRRELYDKITPCGTLSYWNMVYLIESLVFEEETVRYTILDRIHQNGRLSVQDWKLVFRNIEWTANSPVDENTALEWLNGKCSLTRAELKLLLEYAQFNDGSNPTIIISQQGDFIITEKKY